MASETRLLARLLTAAALISLLSLPGHGQEPFPDRVFAPAHEAPGADEAARAAEGGRTAYAPSVEERASDGPEASLPIGRTTSRRDVDIEVLRQAIDFYRRGDIAAGDQARSAIADSAARILTEWLAIRSGAAVGFERIVAFLRDNPDWAGNGAIRRRAEEVLLSDRVPATVVRAFFATQRPVSASGKVALALAFKADGLDRDAAALVRDAWRNDSFGRDLEERILDHFPGVISQADHRFRMERALFRQSWSTAQRAADHAGPDYATLVKARRAVENRARNASALLEAVPAALRTDSSYNFSRAQFLRRNDQYAAAAQVMAGVTRDPEILADGNEWWIERRVLARELLDTDNARAAYEVTRNHAASSDAYRIEAEFHAGWIALRFLDDPASAAAHFAKAAAIATTPISVSRAAYWQGRAAEAAGRPEEARLFYEQAAAHSITYYGQLALGKLGHTMLPLRVNEESGVSGHAALRTLPTVQAIELLYEADVPELALPLYADLARQLDDAEMLDALGDLAVERRDPRALLVVGKTAVQRGFPLDLHAYPTMGIPSFDPVGGPVEKAMVYAIARQESAFNPQAMSSAGARGLMQLMPATARRTAQRFGLGYDQGRLLSDPAYNARLGSAHLSELLEDWRGSYILTFASYNAGGGNVRRWIRAYGDPRSPSVDPVDWVERIPFSETRNYVQRVMENFQIYRRRLGERTALLIESDLRRGAAAQ